MIEAKTPKPRLLWLRAMAAIAPCLFAISLLCVGLYKTSWFGTPISMAQTAFLLLINGGYALLLTAAVTIATLIVALCKGTPWRTFFWCVGLLILGILLFFALVYTRYFSV